MRRKETVKYVVTVAANLLEILFRTREGDRIEI